MATKAEIRAEQDTHRSNGSEFVYDWISGLGVSVSNGNLSEDFAIQRQEELKDELAYIKNGDWKSAKSLLEKRLSNKYATKQIIDDLLEQVNNYISANYSF